MSDKIMLLDGHSLLNRAFYGLPNLTNSEGVHTNAVLGFLNIMLHYVEEEKPNYLLVAFDRKEPTFRHLEYKEYKGNRSPMPKELLEQVPLTQKVLTSMEIPVVTQAGIEADDILGTISHQAEEEGFDVVVVSGDRDLLQLATSKVKIKIPKTRSGKTVTEDYYDKDVEALYGVSPKEFIDMKGLMGDSSDNIPGVPGIGEKTAGKIIKQYHSIEAAYEDVDNIKPKRASNNLKEFYDQALMSKDLATIRLDCDLEYHFKDAKIGILFTRDAYQLFKQLELKSLFKYFDEEETTPNLLNITVTDDLIKMEEIFTKIREAKEASVDVICDVVCADDVEDGRDHSLKCLSLSWKDQTALILPRGFVTEDDLKNRVLDLLKDHVRIIFLDYKRMLHYDARLREYEDQIEDAGVAAYLINPLQSTYDYDDLSRDYLKLLLPSRKEILGKDDFAKVFDPEQEKHRQLAGYLTAVPLRAWELLQETLKKEEMENLYRTIDKPVIATLYDMEHNGIKVKREALKEYGEKLVSRIEELQSLIYQEAGKEFNINSPKQLGIILFEDLKMPYAKKTKTGYSTNADILNKLKDDYPIVAHVLEYRQLSKLKSTYADGLAAFIGSDEKIHSVFHQKVTATGRLSSSDPNLQNIPIRLPLGREIRKVFVPDEGYHFVGADYSQIELRVLAHMAGDQALIEAYHHGADIHTITASKVFGVPMEQVTSLLRRSAKAVNFGIVYGISAFGLGEDLQISRKQAEEYIEKYFKTYPGIKRYLDGNVAFAKKNGYIRTMYGRIRPIPELKSSNFMQRNFGERVAMNSAIQGTAADIIKIAMIRVDRRLCQEGLKSRLILQIHDELLIETAKDETEKVKQILTEEMMGAADLAVPLNIELEEGDTWFDAK